MTELIEGSTAIDKSKVKEIRKKIYQKEITNLKKDLNDHQTQALEK